MTETGTTRTVTELLSSWLPTGPPLDREQLPLYFANGGEEPGSYPFSRGRDAHGYRDEFWIMGQYAGYGTPKETNARFRRLLEAGQSGLSIALDLPTQMGLDSDNERADGEVGKVGVPLDTVDDLIALLDGLPLERVRQVRTTANAIGPIFAAFLIAALNELGSDPGAMRVMLQNDPLKEFSARGTYIFPPAPSLGLAVDVIEYFAANYTHWEPIEFCGYHIRDAGGTPVQEVAIATANGIAYLDEAVRRGVDIVGAVDSLYLFLSAGIDVFEEAAKLRAARRLWARILHERYGVPAEHARINLFVYTLGGALTAQEPLNNVVRVAYATLAAAAAGVQTLATSSYDEALGLPSPGAAHLALRTQQVAAFESGVARVTDPLGGSYYVEALTDALEAEVIAATLEISRAGGAVAALESGFISEQIHASAVDFQHAVEAGTRPVVGVNVHPAEAEELGEVVFRVPVELQVEQRRALAERKAARDAGAVERTLREVTAAAENGSNTIPALIGAAAARATIGEIASALGAVYGFHRSSSMQL